MEKSGGGGAAAAPTGCYKCGRPGHWSRDCPSEPTNTTTNTNNSYPKTTPQNHQSFGSRSTSKPNKVPRLKRPKLTPDLLLSDEEGLGHILRHFPRGFKFRGRGHEVDDLGHLLGMYADWHSQLIPYYPFDQFVRKVEQVCTTKRFKVCIRQLREKVARGVDPTKPDDPQAQQETSANDQDAVDLEQPNVSHENTFLHDLDSDKVLDEMLYNVSEKAAQEPFHACHSGDKEPPNKNVDNIVAPSVSVVQLSEEQKARMEANKLKAMERAAARARSQAQAQA